MKSLSDFIFDTLLEVLKDYPEYDPNDFYVMLDPNFKKGPYAYIVRIKYKPTKQISEFDLYCEYNIGMYSSFDAVIKEKLTKSLASCMVYFMPFERWEGSNS